MSSKNFVTGVKVTVVAAAGVYGYAMFIKAMKKYDAAKAEKRHAKV